MGCCLRPTCHESRRYCPSPTKRAIVSLVGKFYDPLGPVVINFKIFLQKLCEAKLGWDQPLVGKLLEKWRSLSFSLHESQPFMIPRCYLIGVAEQDVSFSLCGFCDSSLKAYAAVISWWWKLLMGVIQASSHPRAEYLS